ncbi:MAG: TonB-dependent receptor [Pseudohongiellaceae bacterium]
MKMLSLRNSISLVLVTAAVNVYSQSTEEILVLGVVPFGASLEKSKIPFNVQSSSSENLRDSNSTSIADFLKQNFSSVSLNDAQNNPLQPDLQYRGFTASPLLGLAQGLAVYQNGNRINEPLGDAVNWDLLPQSAIQSITLSGGSNPLFGQNSLGGALAIDMKDGFDFQGNSVEVSTGSFGRTRANVELGGVLRDANTAINEGFAYYLNIEHFEEDGWRDESSSDALNIYGSLAWRTSTTRAELTYQYGDSDLTGNGSSPVELLSLDREAIFTGPDLTANDMTMVHFDFSHQFSEGLSFTSNLFHRSNKTNAFNGDGSEFSVCSFGNVTSLVGGLEEDDLEELGLDDDDICDNQFTNADELELFLNQTASQLDSDDEFNLEGFDGDELTGTGILSDQAINNISERTQDSVGADFQFTMRGNFFGYDGQTVIGGSYFNGESDFESVLELSNIDPISRLTTGFGTGTFVDEEATNINTETETTSLYFTSTVDLTNAIALTLSARGNRTDVNLRDRSGVRPELNGSHRFTRLNPSVGLTWQANESANLYFSYSESSRAPTPIELACNEGVFDLAIEFAIERGDDPDDVNFECRLPNAFLADPPLSDVVAESFELGARGFFHELAYSAGVYFTTNKDDILFQTTGRSTGLFANVDKTRRVGFESSLRGQLGQLNWMASYNYVKATFEDSFSALSPNHDFADDDGEIAIQRGDSIPGIPANQFKLVADYEFTDRLSVSADIISNSDQYLRGDESNQLSTVDGYSVLNLRAKYQLADNFEVFARIDNLFDTDFETFGLLGEEPGELEVPIIEDLTIPRFLGAAPPRAGFLGIRYSFQ